MKSVAVISLILVVAGSVIPILILWLTRREAANAVLLRRTGETNREYAIRIAALEEGKKAGSTSFFPEIEMTAGEIVCLGVVAFVIVYGLFTLYYYWPKLKATPDVVFLASWLFVAMVLGMFVRVIVTNYEMKKRLFDVTATQLAYPVLFSVIVFYPIWNIGMSATDKAFAVYAAFLNGFFWETVVTSAKPPAPGGDGLPKT